MTRSKNQKKGYILVSEDDEVYQKVYTRMLKKKGYRLVLVDNGQKVLDCVDKEIPDLIILDLLTPVLDGFGVLTALRSQKKFRHIPVIVVSNLGEEADLKRIKTFGATEFIVKSNLSIYELLKKMGKYLKSNP